MLDEASPQRSSVSAEERDDEEQNEMDHHKPVSVCAVTCVMLLALRGY